MWLQGEGHSYYFEPFVTSVVIPLKFQTFMLKEEKFFSKRKEKHTDLQNNYIVMQRHNSSKSNMCTSSFGGSCNCNGSSGPTCVVDDVIIGLEKNSLAERTKQKNPTEIEKSISLFFFCSNSYWVNEFVLRPRTGNHN